MDNQNYMPSSSGPFGSSPSGGGRSPIMLVLLIILGLGTVVFGGLTVMFSSNATKAINNSTARAVAAAAFAKDAQKSADDATYTRANESPFRAYTAPAAFGSFVINFPKTWSAWVDEENSGTQVNLQLNPDFVRKTNQVNNPIAARIEFIERSKDDFLSQYTSNIKNGKLKEVPTTISGLPAFDITGTFSDHITIRQVVVPVRDKVLTFTTENAQYSTEFGDILAQAKIIP